jgi:hypothetical protein
MNKKLKYMLQTSLAIILLLSFAPIFTTSASPEKPKVCVLPKDNMFSTDPTAPNYKAVGDTFVVNVTALGWTEPGVFALSFKLYYDNSILEALSIFPNADEPTQPADHFMKPGLHWPPGTYTKGGLYIVAEGTGVWQADGYAALALTLTGTEPGHVGTGTIAQITFKITAKPTTALPLSCLLELKEVTLSDPTPVKIPPANYDVENGYYEYSPPKPPVFLKVEPETVFAAKVGDAVIVNVTINDCTADLRIIGVEFKLRYDKELLYTEPDWITQGDFFDPFIPHDKYFVKYVEEDATSGYGIVGILILPNATGGWEVFPEGSGTIVTVKFNATFIPEKRVTMDLLLDDVKIIDADLNIVPPHHLEHGVYKVPVLVGDLNLDDKVDILDLAVAAKAYGAYPGHPRWDPAADLVRDGIINILDIVTIAKNFRKTI